MILKNVSVIIVEPKTPGNVGSIARACQNLGISNIILINPCEFHVSEAYQLAKNAKPLLFKMDVRETLEDCLEDHHILVGTTQRRRYKQVPFLTPKELISEISPYTKFNKVGIVFGRENNGLTNEELDMCNFQSAIPAHSDNPVFNLSQAVLLFAYECFNASSATKNTYRSTVSTKNEEQLLYTRMGETFEKLPIDMKKGTDHFTKLFKRVLGRTVLEKRDIRLFHKLFDLFNKAAFRGRAPNR